MMIQRADPFCSLPYRKKGGTKMKLFSGFDTYTFDVELKHPDTGSYFNSITVIDEDDMDAEDFDKSICEAIWNELNYGGYYHEMILHGHYFVDGDVYISHLRYNGFEVERLATEIRKVEG